MSTPHEYEILVIGAGLIGSSVAMSLAALGATGVRVVDFDLEGSLSSSELNAGGVRATWNQPVNIRASQLSIDWFAEHAEETGYRPCGYLWMKTPDRMPAALKSRERQMAMGWPVEAWDVAELRRRVPFINKTDDLGGAIFAPRDGLVNPNLLKNFFRTRARAGGVVFDDRTLVRSAEISGRGIEVKCDRFDGMLTAGQKAAIYSGKSAGIPVTAATYGAKQVINCAGPWASQVASILGYSSPCFAVRRQVCIFDCREADLTPFGMMIDPSGVYFHPEATHVLAGIGNRGEAPGVNFTYDGDRYFEELIWPVLAERATAFERLKHISGWAGLYEVSPDESAVIGWVENGEAGKSGRVFEAHSFSGHGAMHSYATGLALAERVVRGRFETLDLTELAGSRFEQGRLVKETAVI